jgi:hypothetical protein
MLGLNVRRRSQKIVSLSYRGLSSVISPAEESENVQNMDKLLSAIRQCILCIHLLVEPTVEHRTYQVTNPQGGHREHTIVQLSSIMFMLTRVRVVRPRPHVFWSDALLNMKSESKPESVVDVIPAHKPHASHRNMHDSYCEVVLPFKSSPEFLEQYTNASGGIRTGKIMEVLDSTAGSVAYKHILGPEIETVGKIQEQGFYVVTASVDRYKSTAFQSKSSDTFSEVGYACSDIPAIARPKIVWSCNSYRTVFYGSCRAVSRTGQFRD